MEWDSPSEGYESSSAPKEHEDDLSESEDEDLSRKERFEKAVKEIKASPNFSSDTDVTDFLTRYGDIAGESWHEDSGNLLHTIIAATVHNSIEPEAFKLLVQGLVTQHPNLLAELNKDNQNPIFMAIREAKHQLVDYMVSTCIGENTSDQKKKYLDMSLKMPVEAEEGKTCLHLAFSKNPKNLDFNDKTLRLLIDNASGEALATQDKNGKTPMHHAVAFPECTVERVELIELFIRRDREERPESWHSPKSFMDLLDNSGNSVFRDHKQSRDKETRQYNSRLQRQKEKANKNKAQSNLPGDHHNADADRMMRDAKDLTYSQQETTAGRRSKDERNRLNDNNAGDEMDEREGRRRKMKEQEAARKREEEALASSQYEIMAKRKILAEKEKAASRRVDGMERADDSVSSKAPSRGDDHQGGAATVNDPQGNGVVKKIMINQGVQVLTTIVTSLTNQPQEPSPNTAIKRSNRSRSGLGISGKEVDRKKDKSSTAPSRPAAPSKRSWCGKKAPKYDFSFLEENSDQIIQRLRLHYMRTRNTELVISFLYGTNMEDIQVVFDYDRLPRKIDWKHFEKRFKQEKKTGLKFSSVLQYVTFPQVEVRLTGVKADEEHKQEAKSPQLGLYGRKDMKYFFDWLYKKGVRHIIRLSVEDSGAGGEKVHADRFIRESLEHFIIEHLDWSKTDLDPETILHVSSKVKKKVPTEKDPEKVEDVPDRQLRSLSLRWGGSNAVLRAWSEPEGLPLLPHLETIYLFKPIPEKLSEGPDWIKERLEDFRKRLNANRDTIKQAKFPLAKKDKGVKVIVKEPGAYEDGTAASGDAHYQSHHSGPAEGVNSHRWLDCTGKFAREMADLWANTTREFLASQQTRGPPPRIEDDVVLALIDDGVDTFDMMPQSDRILEGKSFDFHNGKVRPSFSSGKGHGTVMASMILSVCPMVKIYPIRLKSYRTTKGESTIDMMYAAQAIQAALDKNATIISMSWSLPIQGADKTAQDRLKEVLEKAVKAEVLMFCAASDKGKFTEQDYPSGPWPDKFFRIGAAEASGNVFAWTPEHQITYVLPGVDVIKERTSNRSFAPPRTTTTTADSDSSHRVDPFGGRIAQQQVDFESNTGSSVATALAAGLAAMIIYCVKASILAVKIANKSTSNAPRIQIGQAIPDDGASQIAHPGPMKRAFAALGTVTANGFIQVWEELDGVSTELNGVSKELASIKETNVEDVKLKHTDNFVKFVQKLVSASKK